MKEKVETKGKRTCVGCRRRVGKKDVVTFKNKDGVLVLDVKGNIPGKGMNLCRKEECFDNAVKSGSFRRIQKIKDVPEKLKNEFLTIING
ncbi:MAG: YlxR family protein [bacterium]